RQSILDSKEVSTKMLTDRPPRICATVGCGAIGVWDGGHCPKHTAANRKSRKVFRHLGTAASERFRASVLALNSVCQRVGPCPGERRDGVRCTNPASIVHHLLEVEQRPDLEMDQRNVVCVCAHCHVRFAANDQGRYVPTLWRTPMSDDPVP